MTADPAGGVPVWTVGDRLRKARSLTGMTTRDFAQAIGASQKTVTDAEGDKRAPRKMLLTAWAVATGVPVEWLLTGQAPVPDPTPQRDEELMQRWREGSRPRRRAVTGRYAVPALAAA